MLLPKENYHPLAHHGTEDMSSDQGNAEAEAIYLDASETNWIKE
ncbi:hypothetical protein PIIN_11504 [Serendipita indica DSM 11827]|uniref:Uncharacterized protein n=1 Tax=Serendipita indica (strain DSM 11827) TaxID=1109443 RepID=G4U1T4_SERID|nr:hypothetical protein PIIN_11504 [Serendipita indica DSM 11827]